MISPMKQNSLKLALLESINCLHSSELCSDLMKRVIDITASNSEVWYAANENICTFNGLVAVCSSA